MKSEGHTGLALLLIAPVILMSAFVVDQIIIYAFVISVVFFVNIPDIDYKLSRSFIGDIIGIKHRGFTHTIYFAVICGVASASLTVASQDLISVLMMFMSGFLGVTLHSLGDAVTPTGINYIPKIQDTPYSTDWFNYNNAIANIGFFMLGFVSIGMVFSYLTQPSFETLIYWVLLYLIIAPLILLASIKSNMRYNSSVLSRFFNPMWWVRKIF